MLAIIIWSFIFSIVDGIYNYHVISFGNPPSEFKDMAAYYASRNEHRKKWHLWQGGVIAGIFALFVILPLFVRIESPWDVFMLAFCAMTTRWIVTDMVINVLLGKSPFYIGTTGWTDITFRKIHWVLKSLCVASSLLIMGLWWLK